MPKRIAAWQKLWSQNLVSLRDPLRRPRLEVELLEMRTLPSTLFASPMLYSTGSGPIAMVTGDFNSDGKLDLATVNRNGDSVTVLLGNAGGGFSSIANYNTNPGATALATGDFYGNGRLDLAVADASSSTVSILTNDGAGGFSNRVDIPVPSTPKGVVAGDFNGDGKVDLAVANGTNVSILLGNGNGTFQPATNFAVGSTATFLTTGYFSSDHNLDLAVVTSSNVAILLGNGSGGFSSPIVLLPGTSPSYVAVGDFNGDGKSDLAVVVNSVATNNVEILLSNGNGTFGNPTNVSTGGATAAAVAVGDFNGDGKLDLAMANGPSSTTSLSLTVGVSFGNGSGGFAANPTTYLAGLDPVFIVAGDFSGDGKLDLAVSNSNGANYVTMLQGNGTGGFLSPTNFAAGADPIAATTGDFNADNKTDLAIANFAGNAATVLSGNGSGGFTIQSSNPVGSANPYSIVAGNFIKSSNITDLAIANYNGSTVSVLVGNGNGTFSNPVNYNAGNAETSIAVGDFTGNGILDLAVTNYNSLNASNPSSVNPADYSVSILLGNGNGTFGPATTFSAGVNPAYITVADFNGDGKLDLAIADQGVYSHFAAGVSVLFGNGNGTFGLPQFTQIGDSLAYPNWVGVGDFNGDGKPDMVVSVLGDDNMGLLLNNGNGTFPATATLIPTRPGPSAIVVADFNGDGKLDLAVANSTVEVDPSDFNTLPPIPLSDVSVFLGNGNGTFATPLNYLTGYNSESLVTGDFNGDGKPDLAVINEGDNDATVLMNQITASRLTVSAASTQTAGTPFSITVTATDQFGSTATGYAGTVHFSKTDTASGAAVPADYTFVAADHGQHVFTGTATLFTVGTQTLTATDTLSSSISGSRTVIVNGAAAKNFIVTATPTTIPSGNSATITVTALDQFGNRATSYTGTVQFTKTDTGSGSAVPANYTFVAGDDGQHVFSSGLTLVTVGTQTVTAADTATTSIAGSAAVTVTVGNVSHFAITTSVSAATAGTPFSLTVKALDASGNPVTGYTGTVHFSKSDNNGSASVPADYTFIAGDNGQHVFSGVILATAPSQTVTASDTASSSISGSATVTVNAAIASHYSVMLSATPVTAGTPITVTVTAQDQFGNTATGYTGKVHFTKSDTNASALVPPDYTFVASDNGQHVFTNGVTLVTAGLQTVTATDAGSSNISGLATVTVNPAAATHYTVILPTGPITAGTALTVTVTALDQFGNKATGYTGKVHFTKSDTNSNALVPADYTFVASDNGQHIFSSGTMLVTAGLQTVTATDTASNTISGSTMVTVGAGAASTFALTAPTSATAGVAFTVTATALDQFGNTATGYTGTVMFLTTAGPPPRSTVPAAYTFVPADNGMHVFTNAVTLQPAQVVQVQALDSVSNTIFGNAAVTVSPAAASHLILITPSPFTATAGTGFLVTVEALDPFGNTATGYTGTVAFTSTGHATLPLNSTLASGVGVFNFALTTAGLQTITATDAASSSITGNSAVTIPAATAQTFMVTAPTPATPGVAFNLTVTALDQFGNQAKGYTGTVHFTKSDTSNGSIVPADYQFVASDNGQHVFASGVTLNTTGSQTLTATDTATNSINGSATVTVIGSVATHFSVTVAGSTVTAGAPFNITVTALDQFGNTVKGYTGTVHFTKSDTASGSSVPADYTFVPSDNGVHIFANGAVLAKPGSQTVTATDTGSSSISGSALVTVKAGSATHFTITSAQTAVTAGSPFTFTVTALDVVGNMATGYAGTVHFSTSDTSPAAVLPQDYTFVNGDNGQHVFSAGATLITAGSQTVTAKDTQTTSVVGTGTVTVNGASATHLAVTAPSSAGAAVPFSVTVTALDQFGNTATGYSGSVHFKSTDNAANLPPDSSLTAGVGSFSVSLQTLGTQQITATDASTSTITGVSGLITVGPGAPNHFAVTAPGVATMGSPFNFTVTIQDALYNTVPGYTGTVHFTSTDRSASLPADVTLTNGVGTFSATLKTAGSQLITVYDVASNALTGRSAPIAVSTAASHFVVAAPAGTQAGSVLVFTVTALDQFNVVSSSYTGTVRLTSSDGQASLATNATLTGGVGFFAAVLRTAGNQTISATDTVSAGITGTSASIGVSALAATHFALSVPTSPVTGSPASVTVKAEDPFGNVAQTYAGTVHFTSTDKSAQLPADSTLSSGVGTFSATFNTPGTQTLSATDTASAAITGTSNSAFALGLAVSSLTPTPSGFIAIFNKPFDPSQINLYDASGTFGPDDVTLTGPNSPPTSYYGSLIIDPTNTTITFVKTSTFSTPVNSFDPSTGVLGAGTYTVTFRSAANGFKDLQGGLLEGNANGIPGVNYSTTFVVSATPAVVVGVPGFARGPDSTHTVNLPNNQALGIPISLSNAKSVTSGSFTLQYNSALLVVSGVAVNSALTGATLTLAASSTPGTAVINFTSPTGLASGPLRLGGLVATVPNSAASVYKSKALLHFSSVQLNGGAILVTPDDAVQVDAYLGDATGDGVLSGGDSSAISRVSTGLDSNPALGIVGGFSPFPLADPVLIGDLTTTGNVSAASVTLINSFLSGTPRPQLPPIPTTLAINATGPDPDLSLPTNILAVAGSIVIVPVQIDTARPAGSTGMTEAVLALRFNPQVFSVSAADVQLGSLPSAGQGWQLESAVNSQTGEIGIDLFSSTPIQTTASGSLVTIALHVRDTAPTGATGLSIATQVNPTGQRLYQTTVADADGALVLHPTATPQGTMPGAPGLVTITGSPFAVDQLIAPLQSVGMEQLITNSGQPEELSAPRSDDRKASPVSGQADVRLAIDGAIATETLAIVDTAESRGQQATAIADDRSTFIDLESGDPPMGTNPPPEGLLGVWLPGINLNEWSAENVEPEIVERLFANSDLAWRGSAW